MTTEVLAEPPEPRQRPSLEPSHATRPPRRVAEGALRQRYAATVAYELLNGTRPASPLIIEADRQFGLSWVQRDVLQFRQQLTFHRDLGVPVPCLSSSDDVPIPLLLNVSEGMHGNIEGAQGRFASTADDLLNDKTLDLLRLEPGQASVCFGDRLVTFLEARFAVIDRGPLGATRRLIATRPPGRGAPPMFRFTVHATAGLRVHVSPIYVVRSPDEPAEVWGDCLTTPVVSLLGSGKWIFGSSKPGDRVRWDTSASYTVPDRDQAFLP